jgi:hypothetical protein
MVAVKVVINLVYLLNLQHKKEIIYTYMNICIIKIQTLLNTETPVW